MVDFIKEVQDDLEGQEQRSHSFLYESRLFHASVAAMQGILSNKALTDHINDETYGNEEFEAYLSTNAARAAKALLAELNKEGGE